MNFEEILVIGTWTLLLVKYNILTDFNLSDASTANLPKHRLAYK